MVVHNETSLQDQCWGLTTNRINIQNVSTNNHINNIQSDTMFNKLQKCQNFDYSFDNEPMVEWKNPFNMRQVTLCNISGNTLRSMVQRNHNPRIRGRCVTSATKSLDLLRQNLQSAINKDIDTVIKGYLEKFFNPAIENIRSNLGNNSVTEEHLREVCRSILEEAKLYYLNKSPLLRKRESDIDCDIQAGWVKRRRIITPITVPLPKLDPLRINSKTLFMLAPRAHKVLGLAGVRGRLFVKHPDLMRYTADQEDRDWLTSKNHLPSSSTIPSYVIILDDVKEIVNREEYKLSPNVMLSELHGFEVPEFLLIKIQNYMNQLKSILQSHCNNNLHNSIEMIGFGTNLGIKPPEYCSSSSPSLLSSSSSASLVSTSFNHQYTDSKLPESSDDCLKIPQSTSTNNMDSNTNSSLAESHSTLTALLSAHHVGPQ